jgi:exodeoxyribonuclease-3
VKVATWNVHGIRARETQVAEWIAAESPDVVFLQELKATGEQVPASICELSGYWCHWHGTKAYSGVGLHLKKETFPAEPLFDHPEFDFETRAATATLGDLVVASLYVPNGGKDFDAKMRFLAALEAFVAREHAAGKRVLLGGDFNVTHTDRDVHPKERKPGMIGQRPDERAQLSRILSLGLVDVGRAMDPDNESLFPWWAPWRQMRQRNIGWRLDYLLASEALARKAVSCAVFRETGTSDHAPVVATFS